MGGSGSAVGALRPTAGPLSPAAKEKEGEREEEGEKKRESEGEERERRELTTVGRSPPCRRRGENVGEVGEEGERDFFFEI